MQSSREIASLLSLMLTVLLLLSLFSACGEVKPGAESTTADSAIQTVVKYVTGEVQGKGPKDADWSDLEIGQRLEPNAMVKTGAQSACELQLGKTGVLRLRASSQISLTSAILQTHSQFETLLDRGGLTAKVNKLLGNDRFEVRTPTAVFGVRGTFFSVSVSDGKATVAVKEGRVAVLPPSYKAEDLVPGAREPEKATLLRAVLQEAKVVLADQQITVASTQMATLDGIFVKILRMKPEAVSVGTVQEILTQVRESSDNLKGEPLNAEEKAHFEEAATLGEGVILEQKDRSAASEADSSAALTTLALTGTTSVLESPKLLTPTSGSIIDLFKVKAVNFAWNPVEGATRYQFVLYRNKEGSAPVKVKEWESTETSLVWDDFAQLSKGSYSLELTALKLDDAQKVVAQSAVVKTLFRLDLSSKVKAVKLESNLDVESN